MRIAVICSCILLWFQPVTGQQQLKSVTVTMAGPLAYDRQQADIFSALSHPAALMTMDKYGYACEGGSSYGLKELRHMRLMGGLRAGPFRAGMSAGVQGSSLFQENAFTAILARGLGAHLDIGISFTYHVVKQQGYPSFHAPGASVGIRIHPAAGLTIGFAAEEGSHSFMPSVLHWGIGYRVSGFFYAGMEIRKQEMQPAAVLAVMVYTAGRLSFRAGLNSVSLSPFLAAGYRLQRLQVLLQMTRHPQLGFSEGLCLQVGDKISGQ